MFSLGKSFEAVVQTHASKPALRFEDGYEITYEELNAITNQIVCVFVEQGIEPRDVVCLVNKKGLIGYASMLACLKIGATYVNLDDGNPSKRLSHILETCRPSLIAIENDAKKSIYEAAEQEGVRLLSIAEALHGISSDCDVSNFPSPTSDLPAYIMFTSGSTGTPKGAVMTHSNLISFIDWSKRFYHITPDDVLTGVNPIYFDNSVFDFYTAIFTGACLAPFSGKTVSRPKDLVDATDRAGCTIWFSVPSLLIYMSTMRVLTPKTFLKIRIISFGGEGYPKAELKRIFDLYGERSAIYNVYGPTECTCICSSYRVVDTVFEDQETFAPLGHLNDNFDGLILDGDKAVSPGETGELCLLGPNVGAGYYNDAERSYKAFQQNPNNSHSCETMYRTGDLVYRSSKNGLLYFVGRKDNQIKHMGYRIELEEIESCLNTLDDVIQCVVVYVRSRSTHGHIIAHLHARAGADETRVREALSTRLPAYMLPTRIIFHDELPKNANGKVDRIHLSQHGDQTS